MFVLYLHTYMDIIKTLQKTYNEKIKNPIDYSHPDNH